MAKSTIADLNPSPIVTIKSLHSIDDLSAFDVECLCERAHSMRAMSPRDLARTCPGAVLGSLFYQNSTRTRLSFDAAINRLGGSAIGFSDPSTTRAGDFFQENLNDTAAIVGQYCDCLVIRHTESFATEKASNCTDVPIVNAGDGDNEHPTQALTDYLSLSSKLDDICGATIGLVGDPQCRDFKSLIKLLVRMGCRSVIFLYGPRTELSAPQKSLLKRSQTQWATVDSMAECVSECNAICMLPVKLPSFSLGRAEAIPSAPLELRFIATGSLIRDLNPSIHLFHVGPRGEEYPVELDRLKDNSHYFEQAQLGLYMRCAILEQLVTQ